MSANGPDQPDQPPSSDDETDETIVQRHAPAFSADDTADAHHDSDPTSVSQGRGRIIHIEGYEVLGEIARGGMGVVFKARDQKLDRTVALKVMIAGEHASEDHIKRFLIEARAAAKLKHPNIVPIFEVGDQGGLHYFTMEFIEGSDLSGLIKQGPLNPSQAVNILEKVSEAIHYAHTQGILHRDLKPSNILIDERGEPRVADFGLARDMEGETSLTREGQTVGTPSYMSPEQAAGEQLDPRTDVYSLGVMAYEMLCGKVPFQSSNLAGLLMQITVDDPPPLRQKVSGIDRDLETITETCLEKDPARRYRTAKALHADLQHFSKGEPITARPASMVYRMRKKATKNKAAVIAVLLTLTLVVVGGASYLSWRMSQEQLDQKKLALLEEKQKAQGKWKLVFEDDFERQELGPDWEVVTSDPELLPSPYIQNGVLAGSGVLWLKRKFVNDIRIEFTGWVEPTERPDLLWFLYSEPENTWRLGYWAGVGLDKNAFSQIAYDNVSRVKDTSFRVEPGRRYRIAFEVRRQWARLFVDGKKLLEWHDPLPIRRRGTRLAFFGKTHNRYDDLRIFEHALGKLIDPLELAERLYFAGSYDAAAPILKDLIPSRTGSDKSRAMLLRARIHEAQEMWSEAERMYQAVARSGGQYREVAKRALIRTALAQEDTDAALAQLQSLRLDKAAGSDELNRLRNQFQRLSAGSRKTFEDALISASRNGAFGLYGELWATQELARIGKLEDALGFLASVEREYRMTPEVRISTRLDFAGKLRQVGRPEEAIRIYESIERDYPEYRGECLKARLGRAGALAWGQGRMREGARLLVSVEDQFADFAGHCSWARRRRGEMWAALGQTDKAIQIMASVERDYPAQRGNCASARIHRAYYLRSLGRLEEAFTMFRTVERDYPDLAFYCSWARVEQGRNFLDQGKLDEADRTLRSLDEDYKESFWRPHALLYRARVLLERGESGEAFKVLSSLEGNYGGGVAAGARVVRSQILRMQDKLKEAVKLLLTFEKDYADDQWRCALARRELAAILHIQGKPREALDLLSSVEQDFPTRRDRCAGALLMAGIYASDANASQEFLQRATEYTDQRRWSMPARYLLGELSDSAFTKQMSDWPLRPDVAYWKGEKSLRDSKRQEAITHFQKAIELNIPGETWPLLEARQRLKQLGVEVEWPKPAKAE